MQDDSDYLGIVIDPGRKGEPKKAKKQSSKPKASAPKAPAPEQKAAPVPKQPAPEQKPVPVPKQPLPVQKPSAQKPAVFAKVQETPEVLCGPGVKKGIFKDLNIKQPKHAPEAPGTAGTSKNIFCRLNSPVSLVKGGIARDRVPSGVPGLDEMIESGFERNSNILITGGPGSGKTTFLFQFLVNGATMYEEPGLFISFEEEKSELFDHYKRFGWDLEGLERDKKVLFVKYAPHEVAKFIDSGGGMLKDMITDAGIKRIAIDSLTSFSMLFKDEYDKRFNIIKFFDILRTWNCTVMLTAEKPIELSATYDDFGLEFLVDAVLLIYNVRKGNIRERAIEILKMRGTNQMTKLCPLKITEEGVVVFPAESIFTDISE